MNETIKKILDLGFKEYKTNKYEYYDRAWQKTIDEYLYVNVNFWEHSKSDKNIKDAFEISINNDKNDNHTERILIYGFNNFDLAYKRALRYIKFAG